MEISIESVFLLGCALFVIYYIISGCRCEYTNVEGFECGSCPWSTAKCPHECPAKSTDKCGYETPLGRTGTGARYECACTGANANFAGGKPVCLDTHSDFNLDIGILDIWVDWRDGSQVRKSYMYNNKKKEWVEHTQVDEVKTQNTVTDIDKLSILTKLRARPYYIQNIELALVSEEGWSIYLKTWNNDKGKHFYFSDRTGDVYCLSVTRLGGSDDDWPHKVTGELGREPAHIQYIGMTNKDGNDPVC